MEGQSVEVHVPPGYPAAAASVEIAGRIAPPLDLGLGVDPGAGQFPGSGPVLAWRLHPALPDHVVVRADEPERARALLVPLAEEIGALVHQAHWLAISDSVVALVIDGISSRAVALGLQRLVGLLHRIENAIDTVPVAAALRARLEPFRALGRARGFECLETPLGLRGRIGEEKVLVYSVRTAGGRYGVAVEVRLGEPLGVGLSLRPRTPGDLASSLTLPPPLEEVFVVHATPAFAARAFTSLDTHRLLLALAPWAPTMDDSVLTLRAPELPEDLQEVDRLVTNGHGLVGRLVEAARTQGSHGPYR
jgi:hypothetical protein